MLIQSFSNRFAALVTHLVPRLITSRWSGNVQERHTAWEESLSAQAGPIQLESNHSFVLDHSDFYLGLRIPTLHRSNGRWQWGHFNLGYRACQGEDQVRPLGFTWLWIRPLSSSTLNRQWSVNDIPF